MTALYNLPMIIFTMVASYWGGGRGGGELGRRWARERLETATARYMDDLVGLTALVVGLALLLVSASRGRFSTK